jgi:hypothetical protein
VSRHRGRAAHQTCCAMTPLSTSVSGCSSGSDCSGFSGQPQHWWCGVVMRDAIIPDTPWTWPRLTPPPAWCRGRQRLRPHLVEAKECARPCVQCRAVNTVRVCGECVSVCGSNTHHRERLLAQHMARTSVQKPCQAYTHARKHRLSFWHSSWPRSKATPTGAPRHPDKDKHGDNTWLSTMRVC